MAVAELCHSGKLTVAAGSTLGVENDYTDGEAKVFEVLTYPEEIACDVVVEQEVVDACADGCGGFGRVIDKSESVADFCIEDLAGGEGFVAFDKVDDIVWHLIVATPRHIFDIAECRGHYVAVLAEYCGRIDGKCRPCVYAGDIFDR